ncbi:unnamed protein product [Phaedon cochleariae]|uniref:Protein CASC3 n=1 Tax=Phaedon cochleariae TaxID=80249 RepID=A0A9P0DL82_PHACE|nr:unnamed protein product [Phaedon cochleariae]
MDESKSKQQLGTEQEETNTIQSDDKSVESQLQEGAEVEKDKMSPENSDYDSADGGTYSEEEQNVKRRSKGSDLDEHSNSEDGSLILEREEGDGQESVPSKKVDDDEDKKNPQYIPKKGTFYEHDDRTAEDAEETEVVEENKDKDGKKQIWSETKEKWSHDRFNETEQTPKSRAELVSIYGYDIRNEEGPPRARRRRRYGRGPNKYTRNWEDEDAYNKPQPTVTRPKSQRRPRKDTDEEFPPLVRDNSQEDLEKENTPKKDLGPQVRKPEERHEPPREKPFSQPPQHSEHINNGPTYQETLNNKNNQRVGSGRVANPNGFTSRTASYKKFSKEGQKAQPSSQKEDFIQSQNFTNRNNQEHSQNIVQDIERGIEKLSVDNESRSRNNNNQRQGSVPPRLQNEQRSSSKRYSSMRQRSLPEANTPPMPANYPTSFYPDNYAPQTVPGPVAPPLLHPNPQILSVPAPPIPPHAQQVPLAQQVPHPQQVPLAQQVPFPQQVPFAQQVPPPQFLAQPVAVGGPPPQFLAGPPINYVPGQYQGYQGQFNPVATPPTELYQPQGGITYYSTDQQMAQAQRQAPQKRPKAAIPIVAPPSYDSRNEYPGDESNGANEMVEVQQ